MKRLILFFLVLFIANTTIAQSPDSIYVVKFEPKKGLDSSRYDRINKSPLLRTGIDMSEFMGIPSNHHISGVYASVISNAQDYYESLLKNELTRERYEYFVKLRSLDTTIISKQPIGTKNMIFYYVGIDTVKQQKYIIIDSNSNMNFSDDSVYTFKFVDIHNYDGKKVPVQIDISYFDGNNFVPKTVNFNLLAGSDLSSSLDTEDERKLRIRLATEGYLQGKTRINGKDILINAANVNNDMIQETLGVEPSLYIFTNNVISEQLKSVGDTIALADRNIAILRTEGLNLYLKDIGKSTDSSKVGKYLPMLYASTVDDSQRVCINDMIKGKYVLIDFWGSWCGPCKAALPKMIEMYNKIKDRDDVAVIGIAMERGDTEELKKVIKEYSVPWFNAWDTSKAMNYSASSFRKLGIEGFPTYVIVDKTGKIVFHSKDPACRMDKAVEFFMKLIGEEK